MKEILNHYEIADEIMNKLQNEHLNDLAMMLKNAIAEGSSGTEICAMMLGALRQIKKTMRVKSSDTMSLIEVLIADLDYKIHKI
jgi:hypothetical protein